MAKEKTRDYLSGSIWDKLVWFALPLAASSILQQLFNSADVAVAGKFAGDTALAAVGANSAIIGLLVNLFVGLAVGANAVIAMAIGRQDTDYVKKAIHTAILVALISGIFLLILGQILADSVLQLLGTPVEIIGEAKKYFRIYFLGMPMMMLYNFEAAIFRSVGDNKRPLIVLAASGLINVFLNLFFVIVCHLGVSGVAIATVIANAISAITLLVLLLHEKRIIKVCFKDLRIHPTTLRDIARIGIPAGLQGMVFSISNVCLQSAMNALGPDYVAGSTAAVSIESYVYYIMNAFSQGAVTMVGQNYGAGNYRRCRQITRWTLLLAGTCTVVSGGIFILLRQYLVQIFTSSATIAAIASQRIIIILSFEVINMVIDVLSGTMRGYGKSLIPALSSLICICGIRILYLYTIYPSIASFTSLMWIYPISWAFTAVILGVFYFISSRRAYQSK